MSTGDTGPYWVLSKLGNIWSAEAGERVFLLDLTKSKCLSCFDSNNFVNVWVFFRPIVGTEAVDVLYVDKQT